MEWAKLKNIIILVLVLLNVFFLILVGAQVVERIQTQASIREDTVLLLSQYGIELEEGAVFWDDRYYVRTTEYDETEEVLMEGIIAELTQGTGSIIFQSGGGFLISLDSLPGPEEHTREAYVRHAKIFMQTLGMETVEIPHEMGADRVEVLLWLTWEDLPIFSCPIMLTYQDQKLIYVEGYRLLGKPVLTNQASLSPSALLVRFLDVVVEEDIPCSKINAIFPGFIYETGSLSAQSTLLPVWEIYTDAGVVVLNCMTGEREEIS